MAVTALGDGAINAASQAIVKGEVNWKKVKASAVSSGISSGVGFAISRTNFTKSITEKVQDSISSVKNNINTFSDKIIMH